MTGIPCSSPSPELPLKTDVCVKKGPTPAKPPASSFLPRFFRPQNNKSICAMCSAPCGFLLSLKTCYLISPEQKIRQRAIQDGRKEVNSEAMRALLSWLHFSTPKKKKKEEKRGSALQTSPERHSNLIKSTSASFARILQPGPQSAKLEKKIR